MVAIKVLSILAVAGSVIAVPVAQPASNSIVARGGDWHNWSYKWSWGNRGQGRPEQPSQPTQPEQPTQPTQPEQPTQPTQPEVPTTTQWTDAPAESSAQPVPTAAPVPGDASGYMAVVAQWRSNMGLPALTEDSKLASNAQDTSASSGGQLVHKLNSGSMAQVMAPGSEANFESIFVGGWLCEMPSLAGLGSSVCTAASQGWNHGGQTGHAEILSSTKYTKIGCGFSSGMCTCDLA